MIELNPKNFIFQYFGAGIALARGGVNDEIKQDLNGLFNYGGHKDQITFMCDTFGYILTTKEKLAHGVAQWKAQPAFAAASITPRSESRKMFLTSAMEKAKREASEFVSQIALENFLPSGPCEIIEYAIPFRK